MQVASSALTFAGTDQELLDGVFESSRIGCGLLAFHSAFLHYIARPPGVAIDKVCYKSYFLSLCPEQTLPPLCKAGCAISPGQSVALLRKG